MRPDHKIIAELVKPGSKVIDIGCGEGALLRDLQTNKNVIGRGLEIEAGKVATAVKSGLSVIQGDADIDLKYYPDRGFDYAIIGVTLQATKKPKDVLEEALRIAERVVVVIPNFGHIRNRLYLVFKGRMPVTKELSYQWYETPNIHFCTIKDFIAFADETGSQIEKRMYMIKDGRARDFSGNGSFAANLFGEYGVFILKKP